MRRVTTSPLTALRSSGSGPRRWQRWTTWATRNRHRSSARRSRCLIAGNDLLGQAATGTGKTAAFALPVLELIDTTASAAPSPVALDPGADPRARRAGERGDLQVRPPSRREGRARSTAASRSTANSSSSTAACTSWSQRRGGRSITSAVARCRSTRSRSSSSTRPTRCSTWASPTTSSRSSTPRRASRQTVMFSATLPSRINSIAKRYQRDPIRIQIGKGDSQAAARR